jgi:hypothetical protein
MTHLRLKDIFRKPVKVLEPLTYRVEEPEDMTDEIELALMELKDSFDLPTEEVERAIASRRVSIGNRKK